MAEGDPYSGLFGAYRYAFHQSDSLLFRGYVAVSAVVGAIVSLFLALGVISWVASPGAFGETALLAVIGVLVLAPLFAPVLVVARRHRLDRDGGGRVLAVAGTGFLASIVLALFVSDPDPDVGALPAPLDGVVTYVNSLPGTYGLVPPAVAALGIFLAVRYT